MKITITPTEADSKQHAVSVEFPTDDLGLEQAFDLIAYALMGYGFAPATVQKLFDRVRGT